MTTDVFGLTAQFNREVIGIDPPQTPTRLNPERKAWLVGALREEVDEFREADTIEDEVDALCDLVYFAAGRLYSMGVMGGAHFELVHAANMRKERGELSKRPGSQGYDAIKPKGWAAPDHSHLIALAAGEVGPPVDLHHLTISEPVSITSIDLRLPDFVVNSGGVASDLRSRRRPNRIINGDMVIDQRRMPLDPPLTTSVGENAFSYISLEEAQSYFCLSNWRVNNRKVLVIGHARHGKDTVAEILRDNYGLSFTSSSMFCAEKVVRPYMAKELGRHYGSTQACFDDRGAWRHVWYEAIAAYCSPDKTRLAREIIREHDIYVGLRHKTEFHAVDNACLFHHIVWVDAADRLPLEPKTSMSLEPWMAEHVIDNNGTLEDLHRNVHSWAEAMGLRQTTADADYDYAKAA